MKKDKPIWKVGDVVNLAYHDSLYKPGTRVAVVVDLCQIDRDAWGSGYQAAEGWWHSSWLSTDNDRHYAGLSPGRAEWWWQLLTQDGELVGIKENDIVYERSSLVQ